MEASGEKKKVNAELIQLQDDKYSPHPVMVLDYAHTLPAPRQQAWGLVGMRGYGWGT